jgi:hypothetical protein
MSEIADALSRLEMVSEMVEIVAFATKWNAKLPRYIAPATDPDAEELDAFSITWEGLKVYVHPPIAMIAKFLRKVEEEKVQAVVVTPNWPTQPWWPVLQQLMEKSVNLGKSEEVLVMGQAMKGRMTKLPPGEMIMSRISWYK